MTADLISCNPGRQAISAYLAIVQIRFVNKHYPGYTFFMDYNGDVLMCPHDWGKKIILGNLNHKTFKEIWTSKKAINLRKKLNEGNRKFAPCNVCDVNGELIGKKHAEVWDTI